MSAQTLYIALFVFALVAGAILPIQAGVNAQLARPLGNAVLATLASFVIGTLVLVPYIGLTGIRWPSLAQLAAPSLWMWTGGILGAVYVTATIVLAPRLGAATMIGLIIAGQIFASLFLDHFGLLGFPVHPVNWMRITGAVLLVIAVFLIQKF